MRYLKVTGMILIAVLLLSANTVFARFATQEQGKITQEEHSEIWEVISWVSGLITLTLLISTILAGRGMKRRKVKPGTHHLLAYITLGMALAHGTYNFVFNILLGSS
jgi:acyl-CoA reductase-like NAD-dependent aldehyde dehydrogenase